MHTSTVTVAVLDYDLHTASVLNMPDIEFQVARGTGPGGQHRNTTESCVTAIHKPTGLRVRVDLRSQYESKELALKILAAKVQEQSAGSLLEARNIDRAGQLGTGMRGDKIRTYRRRDNVVIDHRTRSRHDLAKWLAGDWGWAQ